MNLNPGFIERYQIIFEKDKSTQLFAPLAEAYRKMGLTKQAMEVCEEGIKHHPNFISGLVAYANVLLDLKDYQKALDVLEKATDQNPDNILAQSLLAQCFMKLKRPEKALNAYKMLLFLAPNNKEAIKNVKKLESLTASQMDEEMFRLNPLSLFEEVDDEDGESENQESVKPKPIDQKARLERSLSLADAFSIRGDLDKAAAILQKAREELGDQKEIIKRLSVIDKNRIAIEIPSEDPKQKKSKQLHALEAALRRIEQNRRD